MRHFDWYGAMMASVGGAFVLVLWLLSTWQPTPAPRPSAPLPPDLTARVEELEARVTAQARVRCLNVTTERMDLAIFPVDNLGTKRVAKP